MAKDHGQPGRVVRSARDVQKILEMHGPAKKGYGVRIAAVHGIHQSGTLQRLLEKQIRENGWVVIGMEELDGVVAVHNLMSKSAALLDNLIREVTQDLPRPDDEASSSRPRLLAAFQDGEPPLGDGHRGHPLARRHISFDSDDVQDGEPPLGEVHRGHPLAHHHVIFDSDDEFQDGERPLGDVLRSDDTRVPNAILRPLSSPSLVHGGLGGPGLPFPLTGCARHDEAARFSGPLSPPPPALPGDDEYPLFAADVQQEGGFRHQVLLLELPQPRPTTAYGIDTLHLSSLMLEAGTGKGEQPLLRAPELVGLAAMAVAGESPPRHLDHRPALRTLATELAESGQAMRRHAVGSAVVHSLVVELGGRIEMLGTDILTGCCSPPDLLPLLRLLKTNVHSLWEMRVPGSEFNLM